MMVSRQSRCLHHGRSRKRFNRFLRGRTLRTITYRDPATHLEVSREITIFPEEHAIEWVLRLRNGGTNESAMLENILPLDVDFPVPAGRRNISLRPRKQPGAADYAPVDKDLARAQPSNSHTTSCRMAFTKMAISRSSIFNGRAAAWWGRSVGAGSGW